MAVALTRLLQNNANQGSETSSPLIQEIRLVFGTVIAVAIDPRLASTCEVWSQPRDWSGGLEVRASAWYRWV